MAYRSAFQNCNSRFGSLVPRPAQALACTARECVQRRITRVREQQFRMAPDGSAWNGSEWFRIAPNGINSRFGSLEPRPAQALACTARVCVQRCQELPGAARSCQKLPGDARNCQELPRAARSCQEPPGAARICSCNFCCVGTTRFANLTCLTKQHIVNGGNRANSLAWEQQGSQT